MGFLGKLFGGTHEEEDNMEDKNPYRTIDSDTDEEEYVGLVIHFTPHVTYVYISDSNETESNTHQSNIELYNEQDITFEIAGTYTHISNVNRNDVDSILDLYKIAELGVPFVKIQVE